MRLPSKVTPYRKSIFPKFPLVLMALQKDSMTPAQLYSLLKRRLANVSELIIILDCLYLLNKIDFIDEELLCYVESDPVQ